MWVNGKNSKETKFSIIKQEKRGEYVSKLEAGLSRNMFFFLNEGHNNSYNCHSFRALCSQYF